MCARIQAPLLLPRPSQIGGDRAVLEIRMHPEEGCSCYIIAHIALEVRYVAKEKEKATLGSPYLHRNSICTSTALYATVGY